MAMYKSFEDLFGEPFEEDPEVLAYEYALDFGFAIFEEMRRQGLSQRELADKAGMTAPSVSKIIRGEANPTIKTMERLAFVLGQKLSEPSLVPIEISETEPVSKIMDDSVVDNGQTGEVIHVNFSQDRPLPDIDSRNPYKWSKSGDIRSSSYILKRA